MTAALADQQRDGQREYEDSEQSREGSDNLQHYWSVIVSMEESCCQNVVFLIREV